MIVLGVDPGYAIVGYGAIRTNGIKSVSVGYGAITTSAGVDFSIRLEMIYDSMLELLRKSKPDAVSIEKLYFQNNQKTAIKVAQARGVILLAARKACVPVYEYTPLQIKMSITGYGKATKSQIMEMTKRLLNLREVPKPDDTADALAIAICHAHTSGSNLKLSIKRFALGKE